MTADTEGHFHDQGPADKLDAAATDTANAAAADPASVMTFQAATEKKAALLADPAWAERYLNGDPRARAEMSSLTPILAKGPEVVGQTTRAIEATMLSERGGLTAEHIAEYAEQRPVTAEVRRQAVDLRSRLIGDKAWVGRYLDGGRDETRQMALLGIVLSAPVEG